VEISTVFLFVFIIFVKYIQDVSCDSSVRISVVFTKKYQRDKLFVLVGQIL